MLKPGNIAPVFSLEAHDGTTWRLEAMRGRKVLIWFYIEAGTPGCALEGRGFNDHRSYFDELGIALAGISFDTVEDNAAFARKFGFTCPLLSDREHQVALAYGACDDSNARYPARISFLINEEGVVSRIYDQVDPRDHPARVLADLMPE
ncbi:MAG: peroxiredoxin [Candidatus Binataceae bacterium]